MSIPYCERLDRAVEQRGNLCVGVDPHSGLVRDWGYLADARGVEAFCRNLIEAIGDQVAVFKPQSAFFEALGSAGSAVLARVLDDISQAGAVSILDIKRGDIGSTMDAYSHAYLSGETDLSADAITVSPFLGCGSLQPAIDLAASTGRGIYVLCRTSNPEGGQIQQASNGTHSIAQQIVDFARECNQNSADNTVGLVIGATLATVDVDLEGFGGSILVPGIGAQGGRIDSLASLFGSAASHVLPSVSREVLKAGPQRNALRSVVKRLGGSPVLD